MRNRLYDPQSGKFTQEDPIGIAGGLNVYGFAGGDPVGLSDPFGLDPDCTKETSKDCPIQLAPITVTTPATQPESPFGLRERHYSRNIFNHRARTKTEAEAHPELWILQPDERSVYHRIGPGNEDNLKFVSKDGPRNPFSEGRHPGDRSTNGGPYNFGVTDVSHVFLNILPYWIWGNCPPGVP